MPISVSQKAIIPGNLKKGTVRRLSIAQRAFDSYQRNVKAIQLAIKYARIFNGPNTHLSRFVEDTYRAMDAIRDAQKIFQPDWLFKQQMDFLKSYSYHEKLFPFHQYETFWPSFSQPPQLPAFSTFSSSGVKSEESWLPKFYPKRVGSNKPNLNKTTPKTFSTREKSWEKALRYFVPKESREKLRQFSRDLQEDNQTLERSGISKPKIFISSCVKFFFKIWYVPLGGGMIYLFKNFFN